MWRIYIGITQCDYNDLLSHLLCDKPMRKKTSGKKGKKITLTQRVFHKEACKYDGGDIYII